VKLRLLKENSGWVYSTGIGITGEFGSDAGH
jgi:hypothetical protein